MADNKDEEFMRQALELAKRAEEEGEVPVGALVVLNGEVLAEGWNRTVAASDPCGHAEIRALREAAKRLGNYRLPGCELYVTIEPCTMCMGAIIHSRIERVIFGAPEPRAGVLESNLQLGKADFYNHKIAWNGGILGEDCGKILQNFFKSRR